MFDEFHPWALWDALDRALKVYAQPAKWAELQQQRHGARLLVVEVGAGSTPRSTSAAVAARSAG